jgi:hypothetical protein
MFRAFLAHPQEFVHCMVSRSLWQMCGCVVVWLGIRWLVWCGPSSHSTVWVIYISTCSVLVKYSVVGSKFAASCKWIIENYEYLSYYLGVHLEWLIKTTKGLNHAVEDMAQCPTWPISITSQDRLGIYFESTCSVPRLNFRADWCVNLSFPEDNTVSVLREVLKRMREREKE